MSRDAAPMTGSNEHGPAWPMVITSDDTGFHITQLEPEGSGGVRYAGRDVTCACGFAASCANRSEMRNLWREMWSRMDVCRRAGRSCQWKVTDHMEDDDGSADPC